MKSHFTNKFFAGNRLKLRQSCGAKLIIVTANGLLQRGADSTYKFAQDANFWYLTGIDEPDVVLVIDDREEYLIMPEQSTYQKTFDGIAAEQELAETSGITQIYENRKGWRRLGGQLKKAGKVAMVAPPPAYVKIFGMYANPARAALLKKVKGYRRGLKIENATEHLARQRMIKQPEEVAAIQAAVDITAASLKDVLKGGYKYEYEIEAGITAGFRRRGSLGHAFEPIVASGKRACTLHNVSNDGEIAEGDLVVVDVGAEVEHYAADITRTVSFGRPEARQQAVYDAVLEAQKFAIGLLKPGMEFKDYRERTDHCIGEKLLDLGLINKVTDHNIRQYYPHSISHFLGLNVHDAGDYHQPLEPGMVLTVEPGIYIPEENIGVRIEDDILIGEKGAEVLSGKLPRRLG